MTEICNQTHIGERKIYFAKVSHGCGPVTSCMYACLGSSRHVTPLRGGAKTLAFSGESYQLRSFTGFFISGTRVHLKSRQGMPDN